ncbi:hypothetical protein FLAV_00940 [Flavobacteriales bacterium]|nr:hypothetical protein [Flavobacteriales bacterium]MCL4816856.1 SBBP repeat-containing protein [Flavobacteriales bacterium]WKZ74600.1 MAG: SBBP repeat-containing protein [Vicingaceae bacterium]CAG0965536.1 hypothetical protein FLAV_00940 [Flavobacteriales bacterium]
MYKKILFVFLLIPFILFSENGFVKNTGFVLNTNLEPATEVLAFASISNGKVYFLKDRFSYVFYQNDSVADSELTPQIKRKHITQSERLDFVFHKTNLNGKTELLLPSEENLHFIKQSNEFATSSYKVIKYTNIWNGIDIIFYFSETGNIKYDILVKPGAEVNKIQFLIEGANNIKLKNNTLQIKTSLMEIKETLPISYQDGITKRKKSRKELEADYVLEENILTFRVHKYNPQLPLIIDPWATFIGTPDSDQAEDVAMDNFGNAYVTGYTQSLNFPVSPGAFQGNSAGDYDAFVFKLNATGQREWATYYGGSAYDFGYQIKVDSKGNPFISGYSYSNNLFVSNGTFSGVFDTYILKLKNDGTFKWARYFGGSGGEFTVGMGVSKTDRIVIAGFTSSQDIQTTPGAFQATHAGALDIFISVFDSSGNVLWTTYYGGSATDDAHAVNFDANENVIVGGETYSTNFPVSPGAYQSNNNGNSDVYVLKFDSLGNRLWATLLGGTANEDINGIAADTFGNIYVAGFSQGTDFPMIGTPFQPVKKASRDIILVKFLPSGLPEWSTFFGGDSTDVARALTVTLDQFILIGGETASSDFPIVGNAFQNTKAGGTDVFYAAFDTTGIPVFSSYRGGTSSEILMGISADTNYRVTMCGYTYSNNFPVTPGVFQTTYSGNEDVFVWQIDSTQGVPVDTTNKGSGDGIKNIKNKSNIQVVYPNPATNHIAIKQDASALKIFNINGEIVYIYNKVLYKNELLDISFLTPGIYHLELVQSGLPKYYRMMVIE